YEAGLLKRSSSRCCGFNRSGCFVSLAQSGYMVPARGYALANRPHRFGLLALRTETRMHGSRRLPSSQHDWTRRADHHWGSLSVTKLARTLVGGAWLGPHVAGDFARDWSAQTDGTG